MHHTFNFILFISLFFETLFSGPLDLDKSLDEFIIDSKRLHISEYPDAFNPSIVRYQDSILMSFRIRDPLFRTTHEMGLILLDNDFNPISKPYVIEIRNALKGRSLAQDPRLIVIGQDLFMTYNDTLGSLRKDIWRMLVCKVQFDGESFFMDSPEMLHHFDQEISNRPEKNWAPFVYQEELLLSYSLKPHCVLMPLFGENRCETIATTATAVDWDYGELRGGTQAFLVGDEYLGFFHSCKEIKTVQSKDKKMTHYFMGAYTFEKEPPFRVTKFSAKPIIGKKFYNGEMYKTWKPLRCVFPCGYIFDNDTLYIALGRQDHEIWIITIDREKLLQSLIKI